GDRTFVGDRDRAIAQLGGARYQFLGVRCALQERVVRETVKLAVRREGSRGVHGGSCEKAVQEPTGVAAALLVEPVSDPVLGLRDVVVAHREARPPAILDTLRTPDDAQWGAVERTVLLDRKRNRFVQQPEGALGTLYATAWPGLFVDRHPAVRDLWPMVRDGPGLQDVFTSEARHEHFDQPLLVRRTASRLREQVHRHFDHGLRIGSMQI